MQAWDAADEYLLALAQEHLRSDVPVLVINDQFGALALLASKTQVVSWGDSCTSHLAAQENLQRNAIDKAQLTLLPATETPAKKFALVLWRIPKNNHLLQQQIAQLRTAVDENSVIFAAGMQKHLPAQTADLLGALGKTEYLLAQKKARAFRVTPDLSLPCPREPKTPTLNLPEFKLTLNAGPNVFAHDKFDIGARFFIEQFSKLPAANRIADLGCGNGVLGLRLKQLHPNAAIELFDESYQAIAAAHSNFAINGLDSILPATQFHIDDIFSQYTGEPFDLIVCNPPFHQGHVVGDHIAWEMFAQSKKHLRSGGELWIVGNRHLDYHIKLKKIFGNCKQIAANAKFVVLSARAA
ncbi:MAG: methyltransferase [Spongiibacteraceae bacterium]